MGKPPPFDPTTRYGMTDDITLCPYCQWRTEFAPTGRPDQEEIHICRNPACGYVFLAFADPEDFDEDGNFIDNDDNDTDSEDNA